MARIRTIKPQFFRHELMQDMEAEKPELRPMLVFAGLWTLCDSKGRFEWKPRTIKLDVLPFLDFDMGASLLFLESNSLITRYEVDGKQYGFIPSFIEHQRITGKEAESGEKFPEPPEINDLDDGNNGETPEKQPDAQEKEKEKEKEKEGKEERSMDGKPQRSARKKTEFTEDFVNACALYPRRSGDDPKKDAFKAWNARLKEGATPEQIMSGIVRYQKYIEAKGDTGTEYVKQMRTFLGPENHFLAEWIFKPRPNKQQALQQQNEAAAQRWLAQQSQQPQDFDGWLQ